jgi:hypothetical protein
MSERVELNQAPLFPYGLPYAGKLTSSEDLVVIERVRAEVARWTYKPGWAFTVEAPGASDLIVIHVDVELEGPEGKVSYHNVHANISYWVPRNIVDFIRFHLDRLINEIERKHLELWLVQAPLPEVQG